MTVEAPEKIEVTIPPDLEVSPAAKDVLRHARNLIANKGWVQHHSRYEGRHCLYGALINTYAGESDYVRRDDLFRNVRDAENALTLVVGGDYISWNDAPARREEHVLAVLDELIAH